MTPNDAEFCSANSLTINTCVQGPSSQVVP